MPYRAIIGALGSLFGNSFNNSQSKQAASEAYTRQRELMGLQQQYAVENWEREIAYNDPSAQMARLKAAGLNPNLVYGNGSIQGLESPQISAPSSPSAPMRQLFDLGNPILEGAQAAQGIAMAKKAGAEGIGQEIENQYLSKTLQDRIAKVSADLELTKDQSSKLKQEFNLIQGQINILSTERELREIDKKHYEDEWQKRLQEYRDKHNISAEEYSRMMAIHDDFVKLAKENATKAEWDAKISQLTFENQQNFQAIEKSLGVVGQVLKMIMSILGK